jgi:aldehyde dehydrogenase (NAD+)
VNKKRFHVLANYLKQGKVISGGTTDQEELYIAPTLIDKVSLDASLMQEEIFGPILPVITYKNIEEVFDIISQRPFPLSLYVFTNNKKFEKQILKNVPFGGGGINIPLIHFANPHLPFGGVGYSGMGRYHVKESFDAFSHQKSVMKTKFIYENGVRYAPYKAWQMKLARWLFKP